jgi:O-antigen/teichoic acid export membrane protein
MVAVVAVQGAAYIFQVIVAALLLPEDFGVVRSVDAVLALLVILGSIGMPSLAVKCLAEVDDVEQRGALLVRLILIAAGTSLGVASAAWIFAPSLVSGTAVFYLQRLVWIIPLAACARTTLNYYQGTRQIPVYSVLSASVATAVLPLALLAVAVGGLSGWIWARYGTEAATLVVALLPVAGALRGRGRLGAVYSFRRLTRVGGVLGLSLLTRTGLDSLGTLALIAIGTSTTQIGYYGVGVLAVMGLLILPSCVGSIALPRFARAFSDPATLRSTFYRTVGVCLMLTLPLSALGIVSAPLLVLHFFPSYGASIPIIQILLMTVWARAVTMASGTFLVAADQGDATLIVNLLILSAGAIAMLSITPHFGIAGAAYTTVGVEFASAVIYVLLAARTLTARRAPLIHG